MPSNQRLAEHLVEEGEERIRPWPQVAEGVEEHQSRPEEAGEEADQLCLQEGEGEGEVLEYPWHHLEAEEVEEDHCHQEAEEEEPGVWHRQGGEEEVQLIRQEEAAVEVAWPSHLALLFSLAEICLHLQR